jgi:uncharacterized protein (DUF433 family)
VSAARMHPRTKPQSKCSSLMQTRWYARVCSTLGMSGVHMNFNRITHNPEIMGGKACIRGRRVTVGMIVGQVGTGRSIEQLLADFPYLEREDVL